MTSNSNIIAAGTLSLVVIGWFKIMRGRNTREIRARLDGHATRGESRFSSAAMPGKST